MQRCLISPGRPVQVERGNRLVFCLALVFLLSFNSMTAADEDHFERRVRPLLLKHCVECHGPAKQEAGIRLDQRDAVVTGTADTEPLVSGGDPDNSRLLQVLAWNEDDVQMPPDGKLSDAEFEAVHLWVQQGAVWPAHVDLEAAATQQANAWQTHWAFQPLEPSIQPEEDLSALIDRRIAEKLASVGLERSPRADIRVVVRRLSVALIGLPPEMSDLVAADRAAIAGDSDSWLSDYVNRLLASPHFGERWARHWMDVARYADTRGYVFQSDREYPDAWQYRDWLIRSFNEDMPYDEFLKRQLAADQLPGSDDPSQLAAMGYLTLGRRFLNNIHDIIDDRIDVVSRGMQGLTVSCARCHDHKYDPIPTADYYALYGVFASSEEPGDAPSTLRLVDREKPVTPRVFLRGNPRQRGEATTRHFLTALTAPEVKEFRQGSGRLELAESIASRDNPLTARVGVNRIWMHLFGRGLVESPSDFGVRTPPPTHPQLLDDLAAEFMKQNWSVKHLIRAIVSSETWRQSSARRADAEMADPENRLLSRMERRRLDFEAHRDAILFAAGTLDRTSGGPSVDITTAASPPRRTVYARIDRQNLPGLFRTFDLASPDQHAPQRHETTVPQQALFQLNHPFMMQQAETLVDAAIESHPDHDTTDAVRNFFVRVLQREPTDGELQASLTFLHNNHDLNGPASAGGWSYGYGTFDPQQHRLNSFTTLPHFSDGTWGGGPKLPDAKLGWVSLSRDGGHPGGDLSHCAVRRWTADADSVVNIGGGLEHKSDQGDGVRAIIVSGEKNQSFEAHHTDAPVRTSLQGVHVLAGQHIDFVVECRANESFDSFRWAVQLLQQRSDGTRKTWNSRDDFSGRQPGQLMTPLAQLAQTLLMTNEFVFVD